MSNDAGVPPSDLELTDVLRPDDARQDLVKQRLVREPSLLRWHERVGELDVALTEAVADVPVPAGLATRIMARLTKAHSLQSTASDEHPFDDVAEVDKPAESFLNLHEHARGAVVLSRSPADFVSGRAPRAQRWLVGVVALAACVAFIAFSVWRPAEAWQPGEVTSDAIDFFQREQVVRIDGDDQPLGELVSPGQPSPGLLAQFPLSRAVREPISLRWQPIDGFLDRHGVAFYLSSARGRAATLYVVPLRGRRPFVDLAGQPPHSPNSTLGCTVAVWAERDHLYVLVAQGDEGFYRGLLRRRNMTT